MWVKICGITRYEDAALARESGADAIGIVLTKSRRKADPALVGSWIHRISGIEKVGVFTDESPAYIEEVSALLGLDTVQLHAALKPEYRPLLKRFKIIVALKGLNGLSIPADFPCRVLLDGSTGTGRVGTWIRHDVPFILAGGLTPENVRQAIIQAGPVGVDVSSGVEAVPGIKDEDKVRRFIQEAKA